MDPDPGGSKTCGSSVSEFGSGSATLSTTLAGSVIFICVSDQGVQKEIACLPIGEILEDRDGDGGEDAQVWTGALPAALCTLQ